MLRDLGADLGGVAVDGLLAAEDDVKLAFQLLHLLDGLADDVALVARVSEPPKARSLTRYALSAAIAKDSFSTAFACSGPMESTTILAGGRHP